MGPFAVKGPRPLGKGGIPYGRYGKINAEALALHKKFHGKLEVRCKAPLENGHDLALAYTPGVAEPCRKIKENPDLSFEYTCRGNMVAVISGGTRVLGLGDIGPEAAMPVMEGKSVLYKKFGDIDSIPICIDTKDPEEFVNIVTKLQPSFGGINLEDIASPKCYWIEMNSSNAAPSRFSMMTSTEPPSLPALPSLAPCALPKRTLQRSRLW